MKQHVDEDTVLKLALGLLSPSTAGRVRQHIEQCASCASVREDIQRTIGAIKDVAPELSAGVPRFALASRASFNWLRAAALLIVGFGLGFVASETSRPQSTTIVRQQLLPKPPESSSTGFVACDVVDISDGPRSFGS